MTIQQLYLLAHFIVQSNKSNDSYTILEASIIFWYVSLFCIHLCWHQHHCCIPCTVCNCGAVYPWKVYPIVVAQLEQLEYCGALFYIDLKAYSVEFLPLLV